MILEIYAIHDIASESYSQPFYAYNDAIATRTVGNAVKQPGTSFHDNPEDFRLYHIGSYDDNLGLIQPTNQRFVIRLSDLASLYETE
nr:MAG: nonstructural protein [Microvirus sp.]